MSATVAPFTPAAPRARRFRLTAAVAAAAVANGAVTTATDQVLHVLRVYPPWGQPMYDPALNALALSYRTVYGVLGAYLAAALAARFTRRDEAPTPSRASARARTGVGMRAALAYGAVGFVLSALGAWVAITQYDLGPAWYPLLLAAEALPVAWLGGALHRRRAA